MAAIGLTGCNIGVGGVVWRALGDKSLAELCARIRARELEALIVHAHYIVATRTVRMAHATET